MVEPVMTIIDAVRESVAAILAIHIARPESTKRGKVRPARFNARLGGSAFCIVADRYLLTAHHVVKGAHGRDPNDKFYAFIVPRNGPTAYHFDVVSFPIEREDLDIAVLELGPCATPGIHIPALPVLFDAQADGARVVTMGFPSPVIGQLNADAQGRFLGGEFFLKSHANEGIVSAQYLIGALQWYELNVGWHHGESGGPIVAVDGSPGAFSLMQDYRNVQTPHGVAAGPHRGLALSQIRRELEALGITSGGTEGGADVAP